ncbi:MAG: hypothetical protein H7834_12970 [Magnetococcus sp. YQC-9]
MRLYQLLAQQSPHKNMILIEPEYVDKSHLQDYSKLDVFTFRDYDRFCCRIHIIKHHYLESDIEVALQNHSSSSGSIQVSDVIAAFKENYLACVVVRKRPKAFLSKILVRLPDFYSEQFALPFLRSYSFGLTWHHLEIDRTIAWTEQDGVVSACAAAALFAQFHALKLDCNNPKFPSPAQITQQAHMYVSRHTIFPTNGLTPEMIAQAIREQGYEPYTIDLSRKPPYKDVVNRLMRNVYAYARKRITAPILGVRCYYKDRQSAESEAKYFFDGAHAVTILGHQLLNAQEISAQSAGRLPDLTLDGDGYHSIADSLDHLIVHDDQAGPFMVCARAMRAESLQTNKITLIIDDKKTIILDEDLQYLVHVCKDNKRNSFNTMHIDNKNPTFLRRPDYVFLAMPSEIRIHLFKIESLIMTFGAMLEILMERKKEILKMKEIIDKNSYGGEWEWFNYALWPKKDHTLKDGTTESGDDQQYPYIDGSVVKRGVYQWEIRLYHITQLKDELSQEFVRFGPPVHPNHEELMMESWPLYLWRATAWCEGHRMLDVLFDATDARHYNVVKHVLIYWQPMQDWANWYLSGAMFEYNRPDGPSTVGDQPIISHWVEQLHPKRKINFSDMDEKFGESYYPNYIRSEETIGHLISLNQGELSDFDDSGCHHKDVGHKDLPILMVDLLDLSRPSIVNSYYTVHYLDHGNMKDNVRMELNRRERYIWLINHDGRLVIAREFIELSEITEKIKSSLQHDQTTIKTGHPNLIGGARARIAGELFYSDAGLWVVNNKSGRYSKWAESRNRNHLKNACNFIEEVVLIGGGKSIAPVFIEEIGREYITNRDAFKNELSGYVDGAPPSVDDLVENGLFLGSALFHSKPATEDALGAPTCLECLKIAQELCVSPKLSDKGKQQAHLKIVVNWALVGWWKLLQEQSDLSEQNQNVELALPVLKSIIDEARKDQQSVARVIEISASVALLQAAVLLNKEDGVLSQFCNRWSSLNKRLDREVKKCIELHNKAFSIVHDLSGD